VSWCLQFGDGLTWYWYHKSKSKSVGRLTSFTSIYSWLSGLYPWYYPQLISTIVPIHVINSNMILAKSPPLTHLRSLQSSRQISPDKITTLTEGLERILRKAKELHLVESESPHIQKKRSGRSSQTLNIKLNSKIIESASRIAITSPTKHPPKLSRD
jgi:hypothetical protein